MATQISDHAAARRSLVLRDAVSMAAISLITGLLFLCTLFLFRSFTAHRSELARRWSERGRRALAANKPQDAIADLHAALLYAPGTRDYELLLAQALGQAGKVEESSNYFLGLREREPGDGDINLALARLAALRGERSEAEQYYRAAIYGTWSEGGGVERRAAVRAELANYLIAQGQLENARMELVIAAGNSPESYERDMNFARLFEAAQDPTNAAASYRRAISARPESADALENAGRLAYTTSDYASAQRMLDRAAELRIRQHNPLAAADSETARTAARLLELNPSAFLPPRERAARILAIRAIAKRRLEACTQQMAKQASAEAAELAARWSGPDGTSGTATLLRDPSRQPAVLGLAYETERMLESLCGPASGDDALLLRLAQTSGKDAATHD